MQSFSKTLQKKQCCPIRPLLRPPTHVLDLFTSPPTQKAPNRLTFRNRGIRCPSMLTHFPLREGGQAYLPGQCCTPGGGRWWLPGGGHDQQWVRQAKQCTQGKLLSKKKSLVLCQWNKLNWSSQVIIPGLNWNSFCANKRNLHCQLSDENHF